MDRCASIAAIGCVIALFEIVICKSTLERILPCENTDFLQLCVYAKSATGVPDRILRAYFVELDQIMILEKTVREKLLASHSCLSDKKSYFQVHL